MLQDALALRQSIWRKTEPGWPVCGLPAVLYSDHGADFTSTHIVQVCADLMRRPDTEGVYSMLTMDMSPTLSAADGFRVTTAAVLGKRCTWYGRVGLGNISGRPGFSARLGGGSGVVRRVGQAGGGFQVQGVHEGLREVAPQLVLVDVELFGVQLGRSGAGPVRSYQRAASTGRFCWCRARATRNPHRVKAPSASASGRSSCRNR